VKDSQKKKIIRNAVKCLICYDVIESKHTHDFVSCQCGNICVDGGHDYLRRIGDLKNIKDLSIVE
jgi:hypothetical protein